MQSNDITKTIRDRRSIRKYTNDIIPDEEIDIILDAGRWAPSGLNNQPWSFAIVRTPEKISGMSQLTAYSRIIKKCNACICLFYNISAGYNRDKDLLAIGACIQNMLLAAHSIGIGSVWLGEILNRKDEVNALLNIGGDYELMAVIALGFPAEKPRSRRKKIGSIVIKKI